MTHRQRYRLEQLAVAFILAAVGLATGVAILARGLDHPDFRAVVR